MQEITWSRVMSVWWLCYWRASLGGTVAGVLAGGITGFIHGILGIPMEGPVLPAIAGGIAGVAWSVVVVRMALKKKYRGFRIALLPSDGNVSEVFS